MLLCLVRKAWNPFCDPQGDCLERRGAFLFCDFGLPRIGSSSAVHSHSLDSLHSSSGISFSTMWALGLKWNGSKPLKPSGPTPSFLLYFPLPFLQTPERSRDLLLPFFFFFLPFLLALRLLVLGGIDSVLGSSDEES